MKKEKKRINSKKLIIIISVILVVVIAITAVVAVALVNYANRYKAETSTVFILDDGKVATTDIIPFDENKYSAEELEAFLNETITTYNEKNGEDSIKQEEFTIEEGIVTLVMEYAGADAYEDIYGVELFTGTVAQALEAGYAFDLDFASIDDGKAVKCDAKEITEQTELKVAIIKTNTRVQVAGKILYLSSDNVYEFDKNSVVLKDNCNIFNREIEDVSEVIGTENAEPVTEEPVVGDDEFVAETETDIVFDFGDEEEEEVPEITYTEKYIYIIYK